MYVELSEDLQMLSGLLITQFVYGTISTMLYSLTVIFLIKNWKHFDNYFFKLYIYQFIFNMWMYWNFYVTGRLPASTCRECALSSWFDSLSKSSDSSFPYNFFFFTQYHLGFMSYTNVLLTSFNRYTLIFMQKIYTKIWHYGTYIIIGIFCLLPLGFTYPVLANRAYVEYNPLSDTYVVRTEANLSSLYSALLVWMIVTMILSLFVNTLCWYKISKYSKATRQQNDYRLFLVSFVTFLIQGMVFCIGTINKISADRDPSKLLLISRIGQVMSPFANDLLTLSTPYVLIIFSKRTTSHILELSHIYSHLQIRQSVKQFFVKGSFAPSSITPIQNIRTSRSVLSKI
ncbi:Protein CBR-SRG-31 [Caenorhabditis briggsae]|uniref:Serpentine receptor class gamma n=1 Tax=Caenorhabditis briggsae TaxID=6238 RepID=A8XUN1_CAEBR|nr:Protein CBR-SRG-31 [Caenorhabditis briggsae]CAP36356.2 Protein CBR-SRG-31 [Caenorhabditis briggsae]